MRFQFSCTVLNGHVQFQRTPVRFKTSTLNFANMDNHMVFSSRKCRKFLCLLRWTSRWINFQFIMFYNFSRSENARGYRLKHATIRFSLHARNQRLPASLPTLGIPNLINRTPTCDESRLNCGKIRPPKIQWKCNWLTYHRFWHPHLFYIGSYQRVIRHSIWKL